MGQVDAKKRRNLPKTFSNRNNNDEKIGAAGELLVQYNLVKEEIDSARLTTDAGVDLVAYSPNGSKAYTIQIKTKEQQIIS